MTMLSIEKDREYRSGFGYKREFGRGITEGSYPTPFDWEEVFNAEFSDIELGLVQSTKKTFERMNYEVVPPLIVARHNLEGRFTSLTTESSPAHRAYNLYFYTWVGKLTQKILSGGGQIISGVLPNLSETSLHNYFLPNFTELLLSGLGPRRCVNGNTCYKACKYRNYVIAYQEGDNRITEVESKITEIDEFITGLLREDTNVFQWAIEYVIRLGDYMVDFIAFIDNIEDEASREEEARLANLSTIDIFEDGFKVLVEDYNVEDAQVVLSDGPEYATSIYDYVQGVRNKLSNPQPKCNNNHLSMYQQIVKETIRPRGPIKKLVVRHRVGAGKTRVMTSVFNNYDNDPRARLLIFSSKTLLVNFFDTLIGEKANDTRFLTHISKIATVDELLQHLEMNSWGLHLKGHLFPYLGLVVDAPDGTGVKFEKNTTYALPSDSCLCGPVYATTYEQVVDKCTNIHDAGPDVKLNYTGLFEWGKTLQQRESREHLLDNMIILMDEVHVGMTSEMEKFGELLSAAKHSVIVGFTGTIPLKDDARFTKVFGSGDQPLNLQGRLHYFDGQNNNMFFETSKVDMIHVNAPEPSVRQSYRMDDDREEAIFYTNESELSRDRISQLHLTFDETIDMDTIAKKETKYKLQEGTGLQIFAPLVARLIADVKAYLMIQLKKGEGDRRGLMILSSPSTGLDLIENILERMNKEDPDLHGACGTVTVSGTNFDNPTTTIRTKDTKERIRGSIEVQTTAKKWSHHKDGITGTLIFMIDTDVIKEGLDVLRIGHVFCNSHFETYSDMVQTYGRADRRCSPQSLTGDMDDTTTYLILPKTQYIPKRFIDDRHSITVCDKFDEHIRSYEDDVERGKKLRRFSIEQPN
jgi:hypothetical protein